MNHSQGIKLSATFALLIYLCMHQVSFGVEFAFNDELKLEISADDITTSDNFSKLELTNNVLIATAEFTLQAQQASMSLVNTRKDVVFQAEKATLQFNKTNLNATKLDIDSVVAQTIIFSSQAQSLELIDEVELLSKGISINADRVMIDLNTQSIKITGNSLPAKIILTK